MVKPIYKIAILGKANSGKNTLAKLIVKNLNKKRKKVLKYKIIAFADKIKHIALTIFPSIKKRYLFGSSYFRDQYIEGALDENGCPLTIRQVLLDIGSKGRQYNEYIWINHLESKINKLFEKKVNIIIVSDLRFIREFDFLKQRGFFIIKIVRQNASNINHDSETQQDGISDDKIDFIIDNNKDLSALKELVKNQLIPKL